MGGEQKGERGADEPEVGGVGLVVAAEEPVGECAAEEGDGGEDEWIAKGGHGLGVEVEEVAEGEGVIARVLLEERGEVGVGSGCVGGEDEEGGDDRGEGSECEEYDGDALAGTGEGIGDGEGFGFGGFVVEPGGDEENERRE